MYKSKMTIIPDQEITVVKKLKEYYFLRDTDTQDNLYRIARYDINLLSNSKYELVKTYISFLYNFEAGLKERYVNYNYHNHIKYEDVQEIIIFEDLKEVYQKIKADQFTTDLSVHENIEIILNLRLAFTYRLNNIINEVKNDNFLKMCILQDYDIRFENELLHYLKMKFYKLDFTIKNKNLHFEER
ncbi:hypothetical protein CW676_11850 [Macrococcoides caseolyticum]|uniref:hypothetical protein n=2 Tax=Macrococcoides caseolyticum TaxID=69966 RepID=UPI000C3432E2|nr:hypothetical protein [Macrococcus caseolyticus]PKE05786.1 hypothetical protein CW692_11705 [Macrococcus caseolyticus]PKE18393.1 hypothetical protein CW679_11200 [Macrococcus caseolyticus]PKE22954.1 hypothetical protein CW689_11790 [Macrococcus caseolyticus]PKE51889.1 hypothetical protein CW676_11850 [Macrococcus caseolyticus]PKF37459.1 hypothetical protein CW681_11950 [Macrococcus caseolyticus]